MNKSLILVLILVSLSLAQFPAKVFSEHSGNFGKAKTANALVEMFTKMINITEPMIGKTDEVRRWVATSDTVCLRIYIEVTKRGEYGSWFSFDMVPALWRFGKDEIKMYELTTSYFVDAEQKNRMYRDMMDAFKTICKWAMESEEVANE
jgi:hypothetical protein